ncbi:MAG: hypothetical protein NTV87_00135 [Ignavibacteriae bacterium]|nr:hypothetical protein [Ignavibacteriota bacterium]
MNEKTLVSGKVIDIVDLKDLEMVCYKDVSLKTMRDTGKPDRQSIKDYNPDASYEIGDDVEIAVFKQMFKGKDGNLIKVYNNKFMYFEMKRKTN